MIENFANIHKQYSLSNHWDYMQSFFCDYEPSQKTLPHKDIPVYSICDIGTLRCTQTRIDNLPLRGYDTSLGGFGTVVPPACSPELTARITTARSYGDMKQTRTGTRRQLSLTQLSAIRSFWWAVRWAVRWNYTIHHTPEEFESPDKAYCKSGIISAKNI